MATETKINKISNTKKEAMATPERVSQWQGWLGRTAVGPSWADDNFDEWVRKMNTYSVHMGFAEVVQHWTDMESACADPDHRRRCRAKVAAVTSYHDAQEQARLALCSKK